MTKSELIDYLAARHDHLPTQAVEAAVKCMIEQMSQALSSGERIEIRGFGSFSLDRRPPRIARNPKTGETVQLAAKSVAHFKHGKELRDRVNASLASAPKLRRAG
jgi:integration host factor subunit beta